MMIQSKETSQQLAKQEQRVSCKMLTSRRKSKRAKLSLGRTTRCGRCLCFSSQDIMTWFLGKGIYRAILKLGSQCNQDSGILGQGSTFFVREILDGIGAKPGGGHIHSVCEHRQALQQSRQIFHGQKMYFLGPNIPESWLH